MFSFILEGIDRKVELGLRLILAARSRFHYGIVNTTSSVRKLYRRFPGTFPFLKKILKEIFKSEKAIEGFPFF